MIDEDEDLIFGENEDEHQEEVQYLLEELQQERDLVIALADALIGTAQGHLDDDQPCWCCSAWCITHPKNPETTCEVARALIVKAKTPR